MNHLLRFLLFLKILYANKVLKPRRFYFVFASYFINKVYIFLITHRKLYVYNIYEQTIFFQARIEFLFEGRYAKDFLIFSVICRQKAVL